MALTDTSSKSQTFFNFDTERFLEMVAAEIKSELLESPTHASRSTFTGTPEGASSQNLQTTLVKRECVEDPNYQELGFSSTLPVKVQSYSHTTNKKQHEITQPLSVKKNVGKSS